MRPLRSQVNESSCLCKFFTTLQEIIEPCRLKGAPVIEVIYVIFLQKLLNHVFLKVWGQIFPRNTRPNAVVIDKEKSRKKFIFWFKVKM